MVLPELSECGGFRAFRADGSVISNRSEYITYLERHCPEDISLIPKDPMFVNLDESVVKLNTTRGEFVLYFEHTKLWCFTKAAKHYGFIERWLDDDCWLYHPATGTTKRLGHRSLGFFTTKPPPSYP